MEFFFFYPELRLILAWTFLATKEPRSKFVVDEVNLSGDIARFYPESPKLDYQFFNPDVLSWQQFIIFPLCFFGNIKNLHNFNVTADTQLQWLEAPTLSEARAWSLDCFNSRGGFPRNNKARSFNCPWKALQAFLPSAVNGSLLANRMRCFRLIDCYLHREKRFNLVLLARAQSSKRIDEKKRRKLMKNNLTGANFCWLLYNLIIVLF